MAGLTTKSVYGLAALYYMSEHPDKLYPIGEIAEQAGIPQKYLEQILIQLKKEGLVESVRGASGGYRFARAPSQIMLHDVFQALESSLCDVQCKTGNDVLNLFWGDLHTRMRALLEIPLTDLNKYKERLAEMHAYVI